MHVDHSSNLAIAGSELSCDARRVPFCMETGASFFMKQKGELKWVLLVKAVKTVSLLPDKPGPS